ncbi:50S ribosomal protein L7/L12 [Candidatus Peregrinibacteria bacterium RIFCSPLOWO2_02_FULL_48_14]|nr:MAG: 50S ribosomal protein L7/L12 [Candidatus Peregrinibacteria bacterium RIFCSPLOWO2_02_FULL_48_14]
MSDDVKVELSKEGKTLIEALEKLNIVELNNVVKFMEQEYGISAAPVAVAAAGGGATAADAAVEEKSSFTVKLTDSGAQKIGVIKAVRELTGLGLKEAKDVVDANGVVMENAPKDKADEAKKALEAAGAKVELQ